MLRRIGFKSKMYPIPDDVKPKFELGTILLDADVEEYSIIVDIYMDNSKRIIYVHRDLSDMTRDLHSTEFEITEWFEIL